MNDGVTFYEETEDLGEVVSNGRRYRIFFDSMRHRTVCVLVAGQDRIVASTLPVENHRGT